VTAGDSITAAVFLARRRRRRVTGGDVDADREEKSDTEELRSQTSAELARVPPLTNPRGHEATIHDTPDRKTGIGGFGV
jgi:hypothetical protein